MARSVGKKIPAKKAAMMSKAMPASKAAKSFGGASSAGKKRPRGRMA